MTLPDPGGSTWSIDPNVPLSLDGTAVTGPAAPASRADDLGRQIGYQLTMTAPAGWTQLAATFALAGADRYAMVICVVGDDRLALPVSDAVFAMVREHRALTSDGATGPWWRLVIQAQRGEVPTVVEDRGTDRPFAPEFVFPPASYRADLERFPNATMPFWLAAHTFHGGRQLRPAVAAYASRTRAEPGSVSVGMPPPSELWARWAAHAAVSTAVAAGYGSGLQLGTAVFEGPDRSGSTLVTLPGGRAVLSGGVANDPRLTAAYQAGTDLPLLYLGAPGWVTDATLNLRIEHGLLSFCFWFDGAAWHAAPEVADVSDAAAGLPPVFNDADLAAAVTAQLHEAVGIVDAAAVEAYVTAARTHRVRRSHLESLLPSATVETISTVLSQLDLAGCAAPDV